MKRIWKGLLAGLLCTEAVIKMLVAVVFISAGWAAAQVTGLEGFDPKQAGANPFVLGGFVLLVMAQLKRAAERRYPDLATRPAWASSAWFWFGLSEAIGVLSAFVLYALKYGAELALFGLGFPWTVALFGLAAGIVGSGYRDLLKTVLGWLDRGPAALVLPAAPAAPGEPVMVGEITPPEEVKSPPSGLEPIPGMNGQVRGFLGGGAVLDSVTDLALGQLVELLLQQANLNPKAENVARVTAHLLKVAPDLVDGDLRVRWNRRADVLDTIMQLKVEGGLL